MEVKLLLVLLRSWHTILFKASLKVLFFFIWSRNCLVLIMAAPIHDARVEGESEKDIEKGELPESRNDSDSSLPRAENEAQQDEDEENDMDLTRTKSGVSIAETFSLPREIIFVATICMAQVMTRKSFRAPP